ncbi:hypothetical protein NL676_038850 [Syzygium grande]|nr:hypothetical protein NL676_038850 [Syzygium grande]
MKTNRKYDRTCELKAFDESKAGVKGLVDAGITEVPRIFVDCPENLRSVLASGDDSHFRIPIIDLEDIVKHPSRRKEVVNEVRSASETWDFFQVANHGIPAAVLEEMLDGVRRFHEQEAANWRDTLFCIMAPNAPEAEDLPSDNNGGLINGKGDGGAIGISDPRHRKESRIHCTKRRPLQERGDKYCTIVYGSEDIDVGWPNRSLEFDNGAPWLRCSQETMRASTRSVSMHVVVENIFEYIVLKFFLTLPRSPR